MRARVLRLRSRAFCAGMLVAWALLRSPNGLSGLQIAAPPVRDALQGQGVATEASISGQIVDSDTGVPVRAADVRLEGTGLAQPRFVVTDDSGKYEIRGLSAGRYTITAAKPGYVRLSYGQQRASDSARVIELLDAQKAHVSFRLPRGGVIVVRVTDEYGEPVPGIAAQALQPKYVDGRRRLTVASGPGVIDVTDDRGEMRIYGLAEGDYFVSANAALGLGSLNPFKSQLQVFYPGTVVETEAQAISVARGQEVWAQFALARAKSARLSGTVVATSGKIPSGISLELSHRRAGGVSARQIALSDEGTFVAAGVSPGDYVIQARSEAAFGATTIQVSGEDVDGLVVRLEPVSDLRGHIRFDQKSNAGDVLPSSIQMVTLPVESSSTAPRGQFAITDDFSFVIKGVAGAGVLRIRSEPSDKWLVQSVRVDGRDVTDTPLSFASLQNRNIEVRLSDRKASVVGDVVDSRMNRIADYVVVMFPSDRSKRTSYSRYIFTARPDQYGRFVLAIPPTDYMMAAVADLQAGEERDPDRLDALEGMAKRVNVEEGQASSVTLSLSK